MEEKRQRSKQSMLMVLLLLILVGLTAVLVTRVLLVPKDDIPDYEREITAELGQLEGKSQEEIQAELDRVVEEGMFHIAINTNPVFYDGASEGNLEIENVPGNRYLMRVEIRRDDTGDSIYSTKYIEPNKHIQNAKLDTELAAGVYPSTATFYAYDPDTLTEIGRTACEITIYVSRDVEK